MANVSKLLEKALSTTSEEEAISCLLMARKYGPTITPVAVDRSNNKTAQEWNTIAVNYYNAYNKLLDSYNNLRNTSEKFSYSTLFVGIFLGVMISFLRNLL